ncbi:MAG TPA: hypothetical protein VGE57_07660 [Solimonas sp.]
MSLITGPRLLALVLALTYAAFLHWYNGSGTPLTPQETERYLAEIQARAAAAGEGRSESHGLERMLAELRLLCANDDGGDFWMLNLIDFREQAQYPADSPFAGISALEADALYNRAIVPVLLRHGGHPLFLASPAGRFIEEVGDHQWDRVAMVRYRSRRDLLEIVVELAGAGVGQHKWAAIERTQVFPMKPVFMLGSARGVAGILLIAVGGLLHLGLRRRRWYLRR